MADQEFEQNEELIEEARSMGWVPEEEFKGDKSKWVAADEFVDKGRHVIPIILANNKRLQKDLLTRDQKIGTIQSQLESATRAIDKLELHYTEANKRAVETAKVQLREELKQAREDGDVDAEFAIQDKLDELRSAKPDVVEEKVDPTPKTPVDLQGWYDENPWFGSQNVKDKQKTKEVLRIAEDLRDEGNTTQGRAFFEEVMQAYDDRNGQQQEEAPQRRNTSKVESGGARSSGGGKTFGSLPAEARAACHADADDLVGPDKRYKTLKEWEAKYTQIYNSEG